MAVARAGLTSGTVVTSTSASNTFFELCLARGVDGRRRGSIFKTGGSCDTASSINYAIQLSFN